MREIVLDTETTGMSPLGGDRLVEIGCIEIVNLMPTGEKFHRYINPEREIDAGAVRVHGLTAEFLADKPVFAEVAGDFLDFIGDSPLVIHNASFDMGFLNMELRRLGLPELAMTRATDTVAMARRKYPGSPASLDALCKRFNIDLSDRTLHGALIDARLLADVYLELKGGREPGFMLGAMHKSLSSDGEAGQMRKVRELRPARVFELAESEAEAHAALCARLKDAVWASSV